MSTFMIPLSLPIRKLQLKTIIMLATTATLTPTKARLIFMIELVSPLVAAHILEIEAEIAVYPLPVKRCFPITGGQV
jgi:hypothetical protein